MAVQKFLHRWRVCLFCGSITNEDEMLCAYCWQHLRGLAREDAGWRPHSSWQVAALFEWKKDRDVLVSMLLNSLKGNADPEDWKPFAKLVKQLLISESVPGDCGARPEQPPTLLIPAPASTPEQLNHAEFFARAVGEILAIPVATPLRWAGKKSSQKGLKKRERSKIVMICDENFSGHEERIVFVDDILTTGSTAQAAYLALGLPKHFAALCIARRS